MGGEEKVVLCTGILLSVSKTRPQRKKGGFLFLVRTPQPHAPPSPPQRNPLSSFSVPFLRGPFSSSFVRDLFPPFSQISFLPPPSRLRTLFPFSPKLEMLLTGSGLPKKHDGPTMCVTFRSRASPSFFLNQISHRLGKWVWQGSEWP